MQQPFARAGGASHLCTCGLRNIGETLLLCSLFSCIFSNDGINDYFAIVRDVFIILGPGSLRNLMGILLDGRGIWMAECI